MNILLIGATGQIGDALTLALARTEHRVSVLVRNAANLHFPKAVNVIERPEFTADAFKDALRDIDHVIYGVGPPEQFMFDTSIFEKVNCELLRLFLDAMQASRARRLTYLSTYEVFEVIDGVIKETHPLVSGDGMTPYSQSKVRGFRQVVDFAGKNAVQLTTIHPAAVYGGLNTGDGITGYMENLAQWRWYRVPFINAGNFPVIHIDSLTGFIIQSLDAPGAFIVSDEMTSLKGIAQTMRQQMRSYVPMVMPLPVVKVGALLMELLAKVVPVKPLTSTVQIKFLTRGWKPDPAKAMRDIGWRPMTLQDGTRRYLSDSATGTQEFTAPQTVLG